MVVLQASSMHGVQAYMELVREARSDRLREVLDETEECLRTFAARIGLQGLVKRAAAAAAGGKADLGQAAAPGHLDTGSEPGCQGVVAVSDAWASLSRVLMAGKCFASLERAARRCPAMLPLPTLARCRHCCAAKHAHGAAQGLPDACEAD